jgi:hypothetical protein
MKRLSFTYLLMLMAIVPLIVVSCNKDEEVKLDFNITVPDDWDEFVLANEGHIYTAERKASDENDTVREYMAIYKESLPNYTLLTYYSALKPIVLALDSYVSLIEEKDTVINGTDFKRMISNETMGYINSNNDTSDVNIISTRYFFFEKSYGYNLVMVCIDTTYDENKPVFDGIMHSFQYNE